MLISFKTKVILELDHKAGCEKSNHVSTKMNLECSPNLDESMYRDEDGFPTKHGSVVMTNVLIQGLVCNIHNAHENGFRNDCEHLRYIISELERGFASVVEVGTGEF